VPLPEPVQHGAGFPAAVQNALRLACGVRRWPPLVSLPLVASRVSVQTLKALAEVARISSCRLRARPLRNTTRPVLWARDAPLSGVIVNSRPGAPMPQSAGLTGSSESAAIAASWT